MTRPRCPHQSPSDVMRRPVLSGAPAHALATTIGMAWVINRSAFCGLLLLAVLTGLAPIVSAWLLRAILDDLAAGHGHGHVLTLAVALGVAGGAAAVLPRISQYLSAQAGRAIQRRAIAELFTAVTRLAGLRGLEDPDFQHGCRWPSRPGSSGPGQAFSAGLACAQSALTLGGFLVTLVVLEPGPGRRGAPRRDPRRLRGAWHGPAAGSPDERHQPRAAAAALLREPALGSSPRPRRSGCSGWAGSSARGCWRSCGACSGPASGSTGGSSRSTRGWPRSARWSPRAAWWAVCAAARGQLTIGDLSLLVAALAAVASTLTSIITSAALTYQALLMFASFREVVAAGAGPASCRRTRCRPGRCAAGSSSDVWFRYGPDQPWILRGVSLLHSPRPGARARRAQRRGQEHAGQAAVPVL